MRTKKVKPPHDKYEYILAISIDNDRILKKAYVSFNFQTTKEFLTFKYILNIEAVIKERNIYFTIHGFTAPTGDLSVPGSAGFEFRLYDFKYTMYNVTVKRKDSDKTSFKLNVMRSKSKPIKVTRASKASFLEIITE